MKKLNYLVICSLLSIIFFACNEDTCLYSNEKEISKISKSSKRSLEEAREIALNAAKTFETENSRSEFKTRTLSLNDVKFILGRSYSRSTSTNDTLMYVFNYDNEEGFAVVSANENTEPLICVTESGTYDADVEKENIGFGMYMNMARTYIEKADASSLLDDTSGTFMDVKRVKDTTEVVHILPKIQTQWGQTGYEAVYTSNGQSGCSNTAMAQIMTYFAYPSSIAITYSGATKTSQTLNWDNIKMHTIRHSHGVCSASDETHEAISQLHRQLGAMNYSQYLSNITWTIAYNVINSFNALGYTASEWKSYTESGVTSALQNNKLIFMGGSCDVTDETSGEIVTSGHHWVADGYAHYDVHVVEYTKPVGSLEWELLEDFGITAYKYLHMNWGVDGRCNGYFSMGVFDASEGIFDNLGENFNNESPYNYYDIKYFDVTL